MKWSSILCLIYLGLGFAECLDYIVDKEKCDKLEGPGTYEKLEAAGEKSRTCIYQIFDITTIKNEINEARTTGTLNNIIPKYENSIKDVSTCLKDYVDIAKACFTKEERKYFTTSVETLRKYINDLYQNDAQRIIEFIENGGIECVKSRKEEITNCYRDNSDCKDFENLKNCTVQELRDNCPNTAAANITEKLLQFVKSSVCTDNKIIRSRRSLRRIVRDLGGLGGRLPSIERVLKDECAQDDKHKLEETIAKMKECLREKPIFLTPKEEYLNHMDNCTKHGIEVFTDCLPKDLKYLPKFMFKLAHSVVRLLYDDFDDIALGLGPCVSKLNGAESQSDYIACMTKIEGEHPNEIPTSQANFCKEFIPLSKCFVKQINDTCVHNAKLDKFSKDYIRAMEEPCESTA